MIAFTNAPALALLLLALPLVIYLGWPRAAYRRRRDTVSVLLRALIVALVVLALAGLQLNRPADRLATVFLVDVSDSMGAEAQAAQLAYIQDALQAMGPDDAAGVVAFGAEPVTERPVSPAREVSALQSAPPPGATDLAAAVRHGLALFPEDTARRLVILSDGRATTGDTLAAARLAAAAGAEISFVPLARLAQPEVQVTELRAPSAITAGQPFDLNLVIDADESGPATVTVLAAGQIVQRQPVDLRAGRNSYTISLPGAEAGFRDFQVQVDPAGADGFYQNNQLAAFTRIIGPPRVLVVSASDAEVEHLLPALAEAGIDAVRTTPAALPVGLAPLAEYDSVILANVPASQLTLRRMEALQSYVRDLGGGLVTIGGPDAYGPGGYFQTPLEDVLPVETQIRDQQRLPQLTLVYLIDRSGSMAGAGPSGVANIELAKEAIIRSIDFLQPTDRAGVVSFDTDGYWIAEIQPVLDRFSLQRLVATLRASGGTDILAGMNLVAEAVTNDPSDRKHIILLTDGGASPRNLVELARQLREEQDVTTSVIAIGAGPSDFLAEMAEAGGGNYHAVDVIENIPAIFTLETVLATRSYIIEQPFVPTITASSPIIEGITSAPPLLGYVATTPRQTAQVVLRGPEPYNDPLLATWQYGLGRAAAFTSDAAARWAVNWVTQADYARFWSQAVRWTITEGASGQLETRVQFEGRQAVVTVDARDGAGGFLNGLALTAAVVDPALNARSIPLRQVAPGRYEGVFVPSETGAYFVGVSGTGISDGVPIEVSQTTGWVQGYSAEYATAGSGADLNLLAEIAALTGGADLSAAPEAVFAHNLNARSAWTPLNAWLLLLALLLLPLDIALRRIVVARSDLVRLRAWLSPAAPAPAGQPPAARIGTLMDAKTRGRQRAENPHRPLMAPPPDAPGPDDGETTAAALLKRRRERTPDDSE
jgi:uncharacterized membrane protein